VIDHGVRPGSYKPPIHDNVNPLAAKGYLSREALMRIISYLQDQNQGG
jgi:hypothetical protein